VRIIKSRHSRDHNERKAVTPMATANPRAAGAAHPFLGGPQPRCSADGARSVEPVPRTARSSSASRRIWRVPAAVKLDPYVPSTAHGKTANLNRFRAGKRFFRLKND